MPSPPNHHWTTAGLRLLALACAATLSACCLDTIEGGTSGISSGTSAGGSISATGGSTSGASSSGSTSGGATSSGTTNGGPELLWIAGEIAIDVHQVAASGTPAVALSCETTTPPAKISVVDGNGDLWIGSQTSTLHEWTPAQQAASCSAEPTLGGPDSFDTVIAMAFDAQGNLWAANAGAIAGFSAASLTPESADPFQQQWGLWSQGDAYCAESLCDRISDLAFDSSGYLWVATNYALVAFSPQMRLKGGVTGDEFLTNPSVLAWTDAGIGTPLYEYRKLAFDSKGDLWVTVSSEILARPQILEFSRTQLENLEQDAAPQPIVSMTVGGVDGGVSVLGAMAFDAEGNMWIGAEVDNTPFNLFRFPPAALAANGAPDLQLSAPCWGTWFSLAFSPIPPGLPIQP